MANRQFYGLLAAALLSAATGRAQDAGSMWGLQPPAGPNGPAINVPPDDADEIEADDPMAAFAASNRGDAEGSGEAAPGEILTAPPAPSWRENATRLYFDSATRLEWRREFGDYDPTPIASTTVPDTGDPVQVRLTVPPANQFYLRSDSANHAEFASREAASASQRPVLIVNGRTFRATRDTMMSASSLRPQGAQLIMRDRNGMLIAFDDYRPSPGDRVELRLTATRVTGTHRLIVYRPDVHFELPVIPGVRSDPTVLRNIRAEDLTARPQMTVRDGIATATISGSALTWFDQRLPIPTADEVYLTSIVKLGDNWPTLGGKLPGISNTGRSTNSANVPKIIDGINCSNSGWGGRPANGCRWSARTGWYGRSDDYVGLATYFYAVAPSGSWGVGESMPMPAPVGKWFALVQRVRINTVGRADGMLSYWLCLDSGCYPQYHKDDIVWRTANLPEARINEVWNNIYCGGTSCGGSLPATSSYFRRMTATRGLPDLVALAAELRTLNGR